VHNVHIRLYENCWTYSNGGGWNRILEEQARKGRAVFGEEWLDTEELIV
jgi:hypothetical protein